MYARISRNPRRDEVGVRRQARECRELAERHDVEVVAEHLDDDRSAFSRRRRPAWEQVVAAIRRGEADVLVAWHPDRITRAPRELEDVIDLLNGKDAGSERIVRPPVDVLTVQTGLYDLTTPAGRMSARLVGTVARYESEHRSARIRSKHAEMAREGRPSGGGTRPFGYADDRVTVIPAEADAVRWAAGRIVAGDSLGAVIRGMPVPTVTGGPWTRQVLHRVLTAPRTAGLRGHEGEAVADGTWPALLDRPTWEKVRAVLQDPARRHRRPARRYLLTGLVYAPDGRRFVSRPNADGTRCYVVPSPDGSKVLAEPLEDLVVAAALAALDEAPFPSPATPDDPAADDVARLQAELDELAVVRGAGTITLAEWLAAREGIVARLDAARTALGAAGRRPAVVELLGAPGVLRARWDGLTVEQKRDALAAVVARVVVAPAVRGRNRFDTDRVQIDWADPIDRIG